MSADRKASGVIDTAKGCLSILAACFLVYMAAAGGAWLFPESTFFNKWYYRITLSGPGLEGAEVLVDHRPHDCEFMTSPIGNKNCHYDKEVTTIRAGKNAKGERLISYDEGKTWTLDETGNAKPIVHVAWTKVED